MYITFEDDKPMDQEEVKPTGDGASAELSPYEAIQQAREWQESAELAIPAEVVTGLIDGVADLKQALVDVRVLLLPDSLKDMRPSMQSITLAKERIRKALALVDGNQETK